MLYEVITYNSIYVNVDDINELNQVQASINEMGYRITSYNVCYTKLLRILERVIGSYLPQDAILREMMKKSHEILKNHPLNLKRQEQGLNPANCCWFWGAGTKPMLSSFWEKTGKKGIMISAVDLLKGIAVGAGMDVAHVEGANRNNFV